MYALLMVVSLIAIATFVTGLLLPLATRRERDPEAMTDEELYRAELAAGR